MKKDAVKGKKYRVVNDSIDFFEPGEIVVALEDGRIPYCAKESAYQKGKSINKYSYFDECHALCNYELEELESEE